MSILESLILIISAVFALIICQKFTGSMGFFMVSGVDILCDCLSDKTKSKDARIIANVVAGAFGIYIGLVIINMNLDELDECFAIEWAEPVICIIAGLSDLGQAWYAKKMSSEEHDGDKFSGYCSMSHILEGLLEILIIVSFSKLIGLNPAETGDKADQAIILFLSLDKIFDNILPYLK